VSRIVLDDELAALREMAEGSRPFAESAEWEEVAALDLNELRKRDARTRLLLGFYVTAKQRGERLEESAASGRVAR
jgi:hypothetical protein